MTDIPGEKPAPQNLQEALEDLDGRVYDVVEYAQTQVDSLAAGGASPDEMVELQEMARRLRGIGEKTLSAAAMIEDAEISVHEPEPLDEDVAYNKVLAYLEDKKANDMVSDEDIQDYLHRRGIDVDSRQLRKWLSAWSDELTADLKEGGRNVAFERVPNSQRYNMPAYTYGLAEDFTETAPRVQRPIPVQAPIAPRTAALRPAVEVPVPDEERIRQLTIAARNAVILEPGLPAATYRKRLADDRTLRASAIEIQGAFETQLRSGGLHKKNEGGYVVYTPEAPEADKNTPAEQSPERKREKPELTPEDIKLGRAMAELLATLGTEYGRGKTLTEFRSELDRSGTEGLDVSEKTLRRLARALSKTGAVEVGMAKQGQGRPRYRVRAVSAEMHYALNNADLREAILEAARTRQKFELPPNKK